MAKTRFILPALLILLTAHFVHAQKSLLQSGPMLGYSDMFETLLWVQTKSRAEVQFSYWVKDNPAQKFLTETIITEKREGFTARLTADEVQPGQVYEYALAINGQPVLLDYPANFQTQTLWQWRTDPPAFKVAVGSCSYVNETPYDRPGTPYGAGYQIFSSIHQKLPDVMLWLGDNTYLREVDWFTRTGFLHRYTHTRSLPELQPLLASTHHYAIWDDHDFGPNDSDGSFVHKDMAAEVFQLFWGNPTYGLPGQGGVTSYFQWADIDFFLLDNRYFRTPNNQKLGERTLLGKAQLEWLIGALAASKAPFKMVAIGGQVLSTHTALETYVNLCPEERSYLLNRIDEEGIKNVVFLTGDRHHTELSKLTLKSGITVYDLTVSPLTSGVHPTDEKNLFREEGTLISQRNFGMLEFSGPRTERSLTMRIHDVEGKELWSRTLKSEK